MGFLLGRKLELWVALEAGVRDWQVGIYGHPLEPRFAALLSKAEPAKGRPPTEPDLINTASGIEVESLSPEMVERVARGISEEPILLATPKKKARARLEPMDEATLELAGPLALSPRPSAKPRAPAPLGEGDDPHTTVLDPTAYERFASAGARPDAAVRPALEHQDSTRIMDARGYEAFGKELSRNDRSPTGEQYAVPPAVAFPGGVLPPRRAAPAAPPPRTSSQAEFVVATGAPRVTVERARTQGLAERPESDTAVTARMKAPPPSAPKALPPPAAVPPPPPARAAKARTPLPPRPVAPPVPTPPGPLSAPDAEMDFSNLDDTQAHPTPPAEAQFEPRAQAPAPRPPPSEVVARQPVVAPPVEAAPHAPDAMDREELFAPSAEPAPHVPDEPPAPVTFSAPDAYDAAPPRGPQDTDEGYARAAEPGAYADAAPADDLAPRDTHDTDDGYARAAEAGAYTAAAPADELAPRDTHDTDDGYARAAEAAAYPDVGPADDLAPRAESEPGWLGTPVTEEPVAAGGPYPTTPMESPLPAQSPLWGATSPVAIPRAAATLPELVLPSPPGLHASPATEWTLAQARESLKHVTHDREALMAVALDYGRRTFEYVAAFAVMRGQAVGWDARGDGDLSIVRQLSIPLDAASVFRTVALTRGSYLGPLPPDALTQHYLSLLGRTPRTVFVWPVEVKGRLVAMLYGDCGGRPVSQRRLADFILFCQDLPSAFHQLILYRKQNPRAAQAFAPPAAADDGERLEAHGSQSEWMRDLLTLLVGPDASLRQKAMAELMQTPDVAAQALAEAFPGPTGWSRLPVSELPEPDELGPIPGALARLGEWGAWALAPLLDRDDPETRYLALLTAGALQHPVVVDGVLRSLFDYEPDISSAARATLAALKPLPELQARLPGLRQELQSQDSLRRSLAARALGVLHDRESIDGLISLTGSDDGLCAQSAAEALRETTRQNLGPNPRAWTAWWAAARGQRRLEWLVEALASDDADTRLSAIEELSRAFGDNAGFFADGPPAEREPAVEAWRAFVADRADLDL